MVDWTQYRTRVSLMHHYLDICMMMLAPIMIFITRGSWLLGLPQVEILKTLMTSRPFHQCHPLIASPIFISWLLLLLLQLLLQVKLPWDHLKRPLLGLSLLLSRRIAYRMDHRKDHRRVTYDLIFMWIIVLLLLLLTNYWFYYRYYFFHYCYYFY